MQKILRPIVYHSSSLKPIHRVHWPVEVVPSADVKNDFLMRARCRSILKVYLCPLRLTLSMQHSKS